MSLVILFHFLCTKDVSDINISIIRSLRLCCNSTTQSQAPDDGYINIRNILST